MDFPEILLKLRKHKGLTQQELADRSEVSVIQIRRYEAGNSQPTLELIKKLAIALEVTADELIFDSNERGPDEDLKLQFDAISKFEQDEKEIVKAMLEALILRHDARRWQK
jgi:transcriptional regulator with XRE-family HTH domain